MTSYYDIVLALIPLTLLGATVALYAIGFALTTAAPIGAVASVLLIGHAMFVRAPVGPSPSRSASRSVGDAVAE